MCGWDECAELLGQTHVCESVWVRGEYVAYYSMCLRLGLSLNLDAIALALGTHGPPFFSARVARVTDVLHSS